MFNLYIHKLKQNLTTFSRLIIKKAIKKLNLKYFARHCLMPLKDILVFKLISTSNTLKLWFKGDELDEVYADNFFCKKTTIFFAEERKMKHQT